MKKNIATLLVFVFTMQVAVPSFAQGNSQTKLQALNSCLDNFFGKVFPKRPDACFINTLFENDQTIDDSLLENRFHQKFLKNVEENWNRASMIKHMVLLTAFKNELEAVHDKKYPYDKLTTQITFATIGMAGVSTVLFLFFMADSADGGAPFENAKRGKLMGLTLVNLAVLYFVWQKDLMNWFQKSHPINQNDQIVSYQSLLDTNTELGITQQLSSTSDSAKKILAEMIETCQGLTKLTKETNQKIVNSFH